ncbi:ribosome biogenesis GTPase YlqF [Facklamia sp. DSM 111018]|uniref:Ribosome biogenesis GTPase A n=1 Tax=Facklamia lactis TaxID=2749967 RepID=A0ABS0LPB2_9LACT|nr:ribosome biogenesis GTPase YlqF [Facklamia lactis]MBG9979985.1 ribosome biogenesis GTPase YlqF [Facklamia lactis]MBG9985335.1 ribosome biogenesis GTPase YlqF [Facklamia lactis]
MANIQWYPGHMAKARREAKEKLNLVDIVIELVDARIPESSRNPIIQEIIANKPSILVLNKSDLADPQVTKRWLEEYKSQGQTALAIDAQHSKGLKELTNTCKVLMNDYFEKQKRKGVKPRPIRLMILGIPNVGKSTLINRFVGKNQAQTGNKPGVTKAQRWLKIGKDFELLDTPGILWPKFEDPATGKYLALTGAIKDQLLEMQELSLVFIQHLQQFYPTILEEYYQLGQTKDKSSAEILSLLTKKMGLGEDYHQAGEKLIQDFRQHKLGNISLDQPIESVDHNER